MINGSEDKQFCEPRLAIGRLISIAEYNGKYSIFRYIIKI